MLSRVNIDRLGAAFRSVRIQKRLRQEDVALAAGVGHATVSRIERGLAHEMTLATIERVGGALGVRVDLLPRGAVVIWIGC